MLYCPFCASELKDNSIYCSSCGEPIARDLEGSAEHAAPAVESIALEPDGGEGEAMTVLKRVSSYDPQELKSRPEADEDDDLIPVDVDQAGLGGGPPEVIAASLADVDPAVASPEIARALAQHQATSKARRARTSRGSSARLQSSSPLGGGRRSEAKTAADMLAGLPPMPERPFPGLLRNMGYVVRVQLARRKRDGVLRALQAELQVEQEHVDDALAELGQRTADLQLEHHALDAPMRALERLASSRSKLEASSAELKQKVAVVEQEYGSAQQALQARADELLQKEAELQEQLRQKEAEQRALQQQIAKGEKENLALAVELDQRAPPAEAAAAGGQPPPSERTAEVLEARIQEEEDKLVRAKGVLWDLAAPMDKIRQGLGQTRTALEQPNHELAQARQGYSEAMADLQGDLQQQAQDQASLDRALRVRLIHVGQAAEREQLRHPRFDELYSYMEGCRANIADREDAMRLLTEERDTYDVALYQEGLKGLAIAGGALAVLLIAAFIASSVMSGPPG